MKKTLIRSCSALLMLAVLLSGVLLPGHGHAAVRCASEDEQNHLHRGRSDHDHRSWKRRDWVGIYLRDDTLKVVTSIRWYYVAMDGNTSGMEK